VNNPIDWYVAVPSPKPIPVGAVQTKLRFTQVAQPNFNAIGKRGDPPLTELCFMLYLFPCLFFAWRSHQTDDMLNFWVV
jgi:hypothetical protein